MMIQKIERVDVIPLVIHWLKQMRVHEVIDHIYKPHTNWEGLTYGQLAVIFITYVLHSLTHRLSGMEEWLSQHKTVIEHVSGWKMDAQDATDDRLGRLTEVLGEDDDKSTDFQIQMGQQIITAHKLPTDIGRYDTTSFNVYHQSDNGEKGILQFGHSKNHRPDLLQFKQGLGTIDPVGIPLMTDTISGNKADDRCYVPAWRRMAKTMGSSNFLFIADCKAASLEARGTIDKEEGYYLFPMPMTGDIPEILKEAVLNPPEKPQEIILSPKHSEGDEGERNVGVGFIIEKQMESQAEDGSTHTWKERWMITRSDAHAERQKKAIKERLAKADNKLNVLKPKKNENADEFLKRAESIVKDYKVTDLITLKINESVSHRKKYNSKGRPGPNTPYEMVEIRNIGLSVQHNDASIAQCLSLAGWRIYVTNTSIEKLSLNQSTQYYRNEWTVERGFHRFKNGCIPALPLFLRLPNRIKGLMMLLMIALQALTLIEYVSRRSLEKENATITGLIPGNPKMKTNRPTAERLLSRLSGIHLLITETDTHIIGSVIEKLKPLQCQILSILNIPITLYDINFVMEKLTNSS
jgi:transposase